MDASHKTTNGKWPEWLNKTEGHLGAQSPLYRPSEGGNRFFSLNFKNVIERVPLEERIIDPAGVIELLQKDYMMGNRTLVEGIERAPWMGIPREDGGWDYASIQPHGARNIDYPEIAQSFLDALKEEILGYIDGKKHVAILLSGGLDSRILAGALRDIQTDKLFNGDIIAFTWGVESSRDVIYAQEIAKRFQWEFVHYPLSAESLLKNIYVAGEMGAESAPYHLHAMPSIRKRTDIDVILAGGYGDGIGRAEYSGVRVSNLQPVITNGENKFNLIRDEYIKRCQAHIQYDAFGYRKHIRRVDETHYFELEQQMHYMRRRISHGMSCLAEKTPLYEVFTAPKIYGLIWGLNHRQRNDLIYAAILPLLTGKIGEIPWARTGLQLLSAPSIKQGEPDENSNAHHMYGRWLRQDLHDEVERLIKSSAISKLGLFNDYVIDGLLKIWPKTPKQHLSALDSKLAWLASFAICVEKYDLKMASTSEMRPIDLLNASKTLSHEWAYQTARSILRP